MTKDSRPISKVMTIIQEENIMVEANIITEEAIITKFNSKIILQEDQDVGYTIKITILVQNAHTKI